ncbi:MAG TPA: toxin-antitoxin system HicB family antitoxin [Nitrosarchaeum sp.]|nr:toxin-antitoxin system HicB family antitoxin [Nitrosarchaeum sp.]
MHQGTKKRTTEHVSFRVNKEVLEKLKAVAKEEKLSLNTYVNQIFDSHVSWDVHASEVGWVVMLKSALREIIKKSDKETITKIAKNAAVSGSKEIALSMRGRYGIAEWISILKDRARSSGFFIKEYHEGAKIKLVMHHDMGENWSLFFRIYYESIFLDLNSKVHADHTENAIVIEIESSGIK